MTRGPTSMTPRFARANTADTEIVATFVAQRTMGTSWRLGVDITEHTALVTADAFAHVHNPVFTAISITAAGIALMVPNMVAVMLAIAPEIQVSVVEEPHLSATHGDISRDYASLVAGSFQASDRPVGRMS